MHNLRIDMIKTDSHKATLSGFYAEASLRNTNWEYYVVERRANDSRQEAILPQFAYCTYGPCIKFPIVKYPVGIVGYKYFRTKCCSGTIFGQKTCYNVAC
jgi:hypothetical protein